MSSENMFAVVGSKVQSFLDENCVAGKGLAFRRGVVAEAAGFSSDDETAANLVTALVSLGLVSGYSMRPGRDGGVCRKDEVDFKRTSGSKINPEWVEKLNSVLNTIVPAVGKGTTNRDAVAHALQPITGEDLLKIPAKITAAFSDSLCPGFVSRRGSGIMRVATTTETVSTPVVEVVAAPVEVVAAPVVVEEIAPEVVSEEVIADVVDEAAVVPAKKAKKSKK